MLALFVALFAALRSSIRSRLELKAEILALRHQFAVLQRQAPVRLRLRRTDRVVWVVLSRVWSGWRQAVQIVSPDTVVRWHRRGFALYWRWKSRPRGPGRPAIDADIQTTDSGDARGQSAVGLRPACMASCRSWGSRSPRRPWRSTAAGAAALTNLACVPLQSRRPVGVGRLLHRSHRHVPRPVCVRRAVSRPSAHRPPERHGAPNFGVDRPTAPRGMALEQRPTVCHPRIATRSMAGTFGGPRAQWVLTKSSRHPGSVAEFVRRTGDRLHPAGVPRPRDRVE